MSKKLFGKFFIFLLIVGLLFAVAPTRQALAQTGATLNVADWSETVSVGITGRPSVLFDGTQYHMWYASSNEKQLFHTSSTYHANFAAGTVNTFDTAPVELGSVTVIKETDVFKMIAYGANKQEFALYTSSDGTAWTKGATVFAGVGLPTGWQKVDAPFLLKDSENYKLYFQVTEADGKYQIYLATSTTIGGTYTLAQSNPVLTPESNETRVFHPTVVKDGSQYYMWYATQDQLKLGLAKSTDGVTWVKSPANPVVNVGYSAEPSVVKSGGTYHLYYMGSGGAVKHVSATGPFEFQTIQAAIDAASAGATIKVAGGTYDEENILITKGITLLGAGAESTYIAPSAVTNNSTIKVQNPSGNVTISGFNFVMQDKPDYGSAVVVTGTGIAIDSATVTISNNVVTGSNDGNKADFGFYGQGNNAKVIIENNTINKTGDNPIVFEQQAGSTIVRNNEFYIVASPDYDPYFSMAYNGLTVSTPQIVEANEFYLDHSGTGYAEAITFDTAVLNPWNNIPSDTGHYTDIQIKDNQIYTGGAYARGIGLIDRSANDGMGTISGAEITGNQIIGENLSDDETYGITLTGDIEGAIIQNNTIGNVDLGLRIRPGVENSVCPSGNDVSENKITPVAIGVKNECTSGSVDASPNWWGSINGPAAGQIVGSVTYSPWCGDEDCSFLVSKNAQGELVLEGEIHATGGITIDQPGLTILLKADTVIQNTSACFVIEASNTRILAEPGAKCIPTGGSNGIDVAANLNNITVSDLEIDGSGQSTGDGIHFAGAISGIVLVDNNIHDLDGDGIEFAGNVSEVVNIQGNMFKANGGSGINNLGANTVGAEYNSWGNVAGPAAGEGVNGPVTSTPFTHADLYVVSSGTPWANQVVKGQQITYTVKAHLVNVNAADFVLTYPAELTYVSSTASSSMGTASVTHNATARTLQFIGYNTTNLTGDMPLFTVTFTASAAVVNAPLSFSYAATSGFGMVGYESSSNVFVNEMVNGSVTIIDLPTLTSTDIQGYYLTGEARDFHVAVSNPSTGGNFVNSIYYVFTIEEAALADLNSLTCMFDGSTPTDIKALMTEENSNLVGRVGYGSAGFPMAPGFSTTTTCTANFNTAKNYVFTVDMVDNASTSPVDFELATLSNTAVVYTKPVITATFPTGLYVAGVPVTVPISITNPSSIPGPFSLILTLPDGTTFTFGGQTYTCTVDGCQAIPVTLPIDPASNLVITFDEGWTGDVVFNLYDTSLDPDRLVATFMETDVIVLGAFDVTGTVSMQGRSAREGVQLTLTGTPGTYNTTSTASISNNYVFEDVAEATYTFTTYQPRYLNITADLEKTVDVYDNVTLEPLTLRGGNAIWINASDGTPNTVIDVSDASKVTTDWGSTVDTDADVNFDLKVNIQDLALVGGNMDLTSAEAYNDWQQPVER